MADKERRDRRDNFVNFVDNYALGLVVGYFAISTLAITIGSMRQDVKYNNSKKMNQEFKYKLDYFNDNYFNAKTDYLNDAWFNEDIYLSKDSLKRTDDLEQLTDE